MICVAYEKPKLAALLFDHVVPAPSPHFSIPKDIDFSDVVLYLHEKSYEGANVTQIRKILPDNVDEAYLVGVLAYSTIAHLRNIGEETLERYVRFFRSQADDMAKLLSLVYDQYMDTSDPSILQKKFLENCVLANIESGFEVFGRNKRFETNENEPTPFLQLSNIPFIDDSKLSWEHILEIRNDISNMQKLRRFRSFASENYKGKSSREIEDDLLTRIYDFEQASNSLGLQMLNSVFSVGGSEKIAAALSTGALALLFGAPITLSAAVGASAVLSNVLVQVVTRRKLHELEQNKNPVRYLIDIKSKLDEGVYSKSE